MSYAPRRRAHEIAAPSGTSTSLLRAFRVVLDTIEYGVLFVDEDLRVRMHNRAFRQIWKVPGDFLSKKPVLRELMEYLRKHGHVYNVTDEDWDSYVGTRLDAIRSGDTTPIESQRTDGAVIQHQTTALPDGGYILTYFDITAGKRAEQALHDSEQRLVAALESTSDGFALFDNDDRLAVCNSRYRELYPQLTDVLALGTPAETIIRAVAERNLVRDTQGRAEEWIQERMAQHRSPTRPQVQPQADGRWLQIDERKTDDGGTVVVFTDITEIKRHEQELAEANRMQGVVLTELHAVLDAVDYGILFLDADLNVRLHNRAYREVWEMPETLFADNPTFHDLLDYSRQTGLFGVPDEHWEEFADSRIGAVKKGEFPQPELTLANGKVLQFRCVKLADGGRMLTYFDITERYRAEQALRDSEERYALVTEAAEEGIYEWSLETNEVYLSPRLGEFLKFKPGELGTDEWPWNDQVHPQDLPRYLTTLKKHLEGRDTEWQCEYRFSDKTGKYHWILDHGATVRDEHGKVIRLVGAVRDITERKEVLQALRESEERFKGFADIAADWFWEMGPDFRFTYISERHEEITGAATDEVLGRTSMERLTGRVGNTDNLDRFFSRLQAHEPFEFEYEWPRPDGTIRFLRNVGKPIIDADGIFQGYRGVGQDITERKEALEALRQSEQRHALAMQAINEGVYDWNISTGEVYCSPRVYPILGILPENLKTSEDWLERIHSDDLQTYKDVFTAHLKGETERCECEYRFRADDGTWRWARQHGLALRNEDGRAYRMIGSAGDITELKQREEELAEKTTILETTLESMDQGIAMYDEELRLSAHNQCWADMLGFSPEFLATRPTLEEIIRDEVTRGIDADLPGDTEEKVRNWMAPVLAAEGPYLSEQHLADGSVIELWTNPLPSGGLVRTVTDVTERQRAEQALRDSEERYAIATRAATEGIYEWDVTTNKLYLSDRAKEIFAFKAVDAPIAEVWNFRVHPDDFALYRQVRIDHFKGRTDHFECEYRFHTMGGQYIWVLERGIAIRNEAGRAIRMIGALSDITRRKAVEIELRQAKEEAEAATRTKSTFLANMSHELRTPLNAIIGFTRLVMRRAKDVLPTKQFENLEKIRTSADHLLALINDILDLSKIEAGHMDIRLSTITVESLIDTCLRTVEPLLQDEALQLIKRVEPDLPTIVVDQEKLRQILVNLLSNAVKFTEKGSIKVTASRQDNDLVIAVADTGIGIPERALRRVFDEFRQVDDSRTRQRGGTGLGLSISRHLARLMGGDVTVESAVGVGSTFSVSIPLRLPDQNTGPPVVPSRFS